MSNFICLRWYHQTALISWGSVEAESFFRHSGPPLELLQHCDLYKWINDVNLATANKTDEDEARILVGYLPSVYIYRNDNSKLLPLLHPFNDGSISRKTWNMGFKKPVWISMRQQMTGFGMQWNQLDHMQTICTSLQTDNHTNTSSLNFTDRCAFWRPTNWTELNWTDFIEHNNMNEKNTTTQTVRKTKKHEKT